ncbi:MAG: ribonuclease T2 [Lysobacterales bacterium]
MPVRTPLLVGAVVLLAVAVSVFARNRHHGTPAENPAAGVFDYYLMSLSWSPTYCATHPDDDTQCARKGYGFVLHGLWPQYQRGGGPQHCATESRPDRKTVDRTLAFMPSRRLIEHEWSTHGACSGLSPKAYFDLADQAFTGIHVPARFEAPGHPLHLTAETIIDDFRSANPGLASGAVTVHCSRGELAEVRVCVDRDLAPRACGARVRTNCPRDDAIVVPALR